MGSTKSLVVHVLASVVIGALGGGFAVQQAKTAPGYVIAEVEVTDPAAMQKYGEKVPGTLVPFQGHFHYLVRTGNARALTWSTNSVSSPGSPPARIWRANGRR